ncbi:acyl carrier protein [Metabacillus bambusae]|uniref:Carrier domain-containing protein n=1 Tax=Metabacillus bambusae TaxID=2795218 RepID=A0ABS3N0E9_9BACI|nr:phosphopantetheine-binding protein [Metabacillus bambusae]MBO1511737.1 hypothetical protein [Metabacillus bambusae]
MKELKLEIVKIIEETCSDIKLQEDQHDLELKELGVDSLDFASIFLALEEKYNVEIPDEEIDSLNTLNLIVNWLENKVG